ncbi:unnamed protein product [Allacma fusca]|uniref:Transcription factor CBF/NF-Y/archaeal histone domain-containing protein n=1 Tax=Allacma fusca TaxID=39272 RepID=A0A8J2KYY2_9HEXA|nr:unnamed protein product [Allacma fusca]
MPNPAEEHSEEFFEDSEDDAPVKLTQLPLARIKRIMKTALGEDSSVKLINKESMFVVAQATELFIAAIAQETAKITHTNKKKTMTMQHLITTIKESENFAFLEGTMHSTNGRIR